MFQACSVIALRLGFVVCCEEGQWYLLLGSANASNYKLFCKGGDCLLLEGEQLAVEGGAVAHTSMELSLVESKCIHCAHNFVTAPSGE